MARKMLINQATRRTAQITVQNLLKQTYFDLVPIGELYTALADMGIVMVQEDNTIWSGILCGEEGEVFIKLAPAVSGECVFGEDSIYIPYENTGLRLTWYRCTSRRDNKFEVIGYIS